MQIPCEPASARYITLTNPSGEDEIGRSIRYLATTFAATASFLAGGGSPGLFAAPTPANWLGGSGNWSDTTKWSAGVVPNNSVTDTYTVNVDNANPAASTVVLGAVGTPSYTVDAVHIDAGDRLYISNGSLNTSALTVNGTLQLDYTSTVTLPTDATVAGTGTILYSLQNSQLAAAAGTLTIDSGLTVRGGDSNGTTYFGGGGGLLARVGSPTTALVNRGTIHADGNFQLLVVSATTIDNQGTLQASNGAYLGFESNFSLATIGNLVDNGGGFAILKKLINTGQTLQVNRPRGWVLASGTIDGGTVATSGPGYLYVPYIHVGVLNNVTLNGNVQVSGDLHIAGTFGGAGTITIQNPEAIEGSGNISIETVPSGITVRGGIATSFESQLPPGWVKAHVHMTSNQGRIRAQKSILDEPGRLHLISQGETITNAATLEVSDGGTLVVHDSLTFSPDAHLVVDGGGLLEVEGNFNLSPTTDFLDVLPRAGGSAYSSQLIATYTGTLTGALSRVTPGITVQYLAATKQIRISGTPVPEPASVGLVMGMLGGLACRRRRRRGFRG